MNLLVTGGCGFIGSHYVRYRLTHHPGDRVVNLDALTYSGNLANVEDIAGRPDYRFVRGSICDRALVENLCKEEHIEAIVNFAAHTHVDRSILDASPFVETNVGGTLTLLDVVRALQIPRYVQVSTDEVYGALTADDPPSDEHAPLAPNSPYAASKAAADLMVRAYSVTYGVPAVITRCTNNYGPCQFPEKLIPLMIINALNDKPLPVYGDGRYVRDWIYVVDHCEGIDLALQKGRPGEIYNFGASNERMNLEIVERILEVLHKPRSLIQHVKDRPGHDRRYALNSSKARTELGWAPRHDFGAALEATIRWYVEHRVWWEAVMTGEYQKYYDEWYGGR
ncbi:MAG: dTDP-glucose 4,6-dehydratase [Candidatus Sumerlaeia bacterium]|nr:dTDP-glucose 4,6-dehydratase [Candidatus Sumerlaeia bacterium]